MHRKIEMVFYKTNPSEINKGLKFVLWEVDDGVQLIHDWGFAEWNGFDWEPIEQVEGYTTTVLFWSNTVNPELLLKEPSKIIKL